ncbi:MAG: hypothetical protein Q9M28_11380 [Mariprofundaceae bacterium]|nr:hypothetical protein [Mariprofundaceae bacterium]
MGIPSANHIRKYNSRGTLLVDMTFPSASIIYTDVAVQGNRLYAAYQGSQQGVSIRDANTLKKNSYFNTGVDASRNIIYLAAKNHFLKYDSSSKKLLDMTFPIKSIKYTDISIK